MIFDYLHSGLYLQLVRANLTHYKELFSGVRSILSTISTLKYEREFGEMQSRDTYLRLLTNNMKRDVGYWLTLNEALLREALTK